MMSQGSYDSDRRYHTGLCLTAQLARRRRGCLVVAADSSDDQASPRTQCTERWSDALPPSSVTDKSPTRSHHCCYTCCRYGGEVMSRTSVLSNAVRVESRETDRNSAARIALAVAAPHGQLFTLQLPDGSTLPLSAALVDVLRASADELAEGHAVTVLPSEVALSPAEAAELLGLSRPFVARLLDQGDIPSERLPRSRHRRVLLSDVLAFQAQRDRRRTGRQRVSALIEDTGLPY